MSRKLKALAWSAFFSFSLGAGLFLTFPYDALGRRLESEIQRSSPGTTVVIREIGPALPFGVRLRRVLVRLEQAAPPGAPRPEPLEIELDKVRLTPAWLDLVLLKPGVNIDADLLLGNIDATVNVVRGGGWQLEAVARAIHLDHEKFFEKVAGVQAAGSVSGRFEFAFDQSGKLTNGTVQAGVLNAMLKGGKVRGFTIPPLNLGSPTVLAEIVDGTAKAAKISTKSPDVEVEITSSLDIRPVFAQSLAKGTARLKFTDAWLNQNPSLKGMLSLTRAFQKPDGALELPINGPLSRPLAIPGF